MHSAQDHLEGLITREKDSYLGTKEIEPQIEIASQVYKSRRKNRSSKENSLATTKEKKRLVKKVRNDCRSIDLFFLRQ